MKRSEIGFVLSLAVIGLCPDLEVQEPRANFQLQNNASPNPHGILFYNKDRVERSEIASVTNNRRVMGWEPLVVDFETQPANAHKIDTERHKEDCWAFYHLGNMIASGTQMPTPDELENAYLRANITNRIHVLRQFLRHSPTNMDACLALMRELENHAKQKTRKALSLVSKSILDDLQGNLRGRSTIPPQIAEELDEESDANIWGELAEMFGASFNSGNWLSVLPGFFARSQIENLALYSPTMKALYKKNISAVEIELEARQTDLEIWTMWQEMAQAAGRKILDFFPQLPTLPKETRYVWPPVVVRDWTRDEARVNKEWHRIIEQDWPDWPNWQSSLDIWAPVGRMPDAGENPAAPLNRNLYVKVFALPLLEACLHSKDFDKANEIYFDIASRPSLEQDAKQAVEMAKAINYTFPQTEPQNNRPDTETKIEDFIGDPIVGNILQVHFSEPKNIKELRIPIGIHFLVIIQPQKKTQYVFMGLPPDHPLHSLNGIDFDEYQAQLKTIVSEDRLVEYIVNPYILEPVDPIAIELLEREGLSANETYIWGILDHNKKYYHGGESLPASKNILDLLEREGIKSNPEIINEFAIKHPDSLVASGCLLSEYLRVGTLRTNLTEKDKEGHLKDSLDWDIWTDYIRLADSLFPHILVRPKSWLLGNSLNITVIKNSRLLQQFASKHIGSVESALQGRPHSKELWDIWGVFAPFTNRSLPSFIETLSPVPDMSGFPPTSIYPSLIKNYQSLDAWTRIINLVEPIWETYQKMFDTEEVIKHRLTKNLLEGYINPLCEAYEKLGQYAKAEKIRQTWEKAEGWSEPGIQ